ncbi:MAG: ABC transporter permease [Saccharofermentanales bacterium]
MSGSVNRTYLKIIFSEIRKSFGRFIAIFAIVALGIGFLAGLLTATPDMQMSVDQYYDDNNMADIFIKSTMGLTAADMEAVDSMPEVDQVMPAYVTDTLMQTGSNDILTARVYGLPLGKMNDDTGSFVNRLVIVDGRMPQAKNECLVEQSGKYLSEIAIGTTLTVSEENDGYETIGHIYNTQAYKVVGIVSNAFYFSMEREASSIGNGRLGTILYVDESCYSLEVYTDLYITISGASALTAFTSGYETTVEKVVAKLEAAGTARSLIRAEAIGTGGGTPKWHVLDRSSTVSYVSFSQNSKKVAAIAGVFPIFFLLVAALIALTTMTRMVEEERTQIGTLKALGYTRGAIMFKYIAYCGTATFLGSVVGLLAGFALLPRLIWNAYAFSFHLPLLITKFSLGFALIATAIALLCTLGATISACYQALKEKPATLMLPRTPKAGKRIFLERIHFVWSNMKFSQKATARNLIRNKKHFILTVIGIAGCTALILTGFGLRDSVGSIADTQFSKIIQYDLIIEIEEKADAADTAALKKFLDDPAQVESYTEVSGETGKAIHESADIETSIYVPENPGEFMEYIHLSERVSGRDIVFDNSAAVATEKLADALGIRPGDTFTLERSDGSAAEFVLTGIAENYVGSYLYIHPAEYGQAFGKVESYNTLMVKTLITGAEEQDAALTAIMSGGDISGAEFTAQTRRSYDDLLATMNFVVIVLILAAGALAVIVLYNLTNININERRKELATLRVLGFHNKEVGRYIFRETTILTVFGTITGLLLGILLHYFVITIAESTDLMFGRSISPISFLLSAAATFVFSFIVNLIMYGKLKKIEMVESMKAID